MTFRRERDNALYYKLIDKMTQDSKPSYKTFIPEAREIMGTGIKALMDKQKEALALGASAINVTGISDETLLNMTELTGWKVDRSDSQGSVFLRNTEEKK